MLVIIISQVATPANITNFKKGEIIKTTPFEMVLIIREHKMKKGSGVGLKLCLFIALMISIIGVNSNVFADNITHTGICGDGLTWNFDSTSGTLSISGSGDMYDYENGMFYDNNHQLIDEFQQIANQVKVVMLNEGVSSIGSIGKNNAFSNCPNIKEIYIPSTVKEIGNSQFEDFLHLEKISVNKDNEYFYDINGILVKTSKNADGESIYRVPNSHEGKLIVPSGIKYIHRSAFANCTEITEIELPNSIETIYFNAFSGCSSLSNIVLSNNMTAILSEVFENCTSLKTITIPSSITEIRENAFKGCNNLTDIYTNSEWEKIKIESGNNIINSATIHYSDKETAMNTNNIADGICGPNTTWELKYDGTLNIEGQGQMYCWESSQDAPWNAFSSQIKKIVIKDGVLNIPIFAFSDCINLTDVELSNTIVEIDSYAFAGCEQIEKIELPDELVYMGDGVFLGTAVKEIRIPEKVSYLNIRSIENLSKVFLPTTCQFENFTDNQSVDIVYYNAFNANKTGYSDGVFSENRTGDIFYDEYGVVFEKQSDGYIALIASPISLSGTYRVPSYVRSIGRNAFRGCYKLHCVEIYNTITNIDVNSFIGCEGLSKIRFGKSEDSIRYVWGEYGRSSSDKQPLGMQNVLYEYDVAELVIPFSNTDEFKDGIYTYTIDPLKRKATITKCDTSASGIIYVPNELGGYPVTEIFGSYQGYYAAAFYNCDKITEIYLPQCLKEIGAYAFWSCDSLEKVDFNDGLETVGSNILGETKLYRNNNNWIGDILYADDWVIDAKDLNLGDVIIKEGTKGIADGAFRWSVLNSISLPDSLERIPESSFAYMVGCSSFTIPEGIDVVEDGTFAGCTSLQTVFLPSTLKTIKGDAFSGCTGLQTIYMHNRIENIGRNAFRDCNNITTIYYYGTPTEWDVFTTGAGVDFNNDNKVFEDKNIIFEKYDYNLTATPTQSKVYVNGKNIEFEAFNIKGNNYFKLRDLAEALIGTSSQFDIGWDANEPNEIQIYCGKLYRGEKHTKVSVSESSDARPSKMILSVFYRTDIDGDINGMNFYNINDNNYVKLRDFAKIAGFDVKWDETTQSVMISTR